MGSCATRNYPLLRDYHFYLGKAILAIAFRTNRAIAINKYQR
ncbi:hypothetical protein [Nostoc sp. FACHB-133]|nr:hypothetical protein [Nostoc sp. FACHB-133]